MVERIAPGRPDERPVVCCIIGTRPEAIKIAPIIAALRDDGRFTPLLISSGQHIDPVDQALATFGLRADRVLGIRRETGTLSELVARLTVALDEALAEISPAAVVVQGDTTTAMAGAMTAFWRGVPTVHVEAGLRSGDLKAPFPEEANRKIIDHLCALHLAPTQAAVAALAAEGLGGDGVIATGNTVVDAIQVVAQANADYDDPRLDEIERSGRRIVLVTVHRRESWGMPLRRVLGAVRTIVEAVPDIQVVVPAHPNPAVGAEVRAALSGTKRVLVCEPLPYTSLARLLARATLVLSDSGGIQEEAPTFGVPVLVLRDVTERWEAVEAGCAVLVGTDPDRIVPEALRILTDPVYRAAMVSSGNPFGDGQAGRRSVAAIAWMLGVGPRPEPYVSSHGSRWDAQELAVAIR